MVTQPISFVIESTLRGMNGCRVSTRSQLLCSPTPYSCKKKLKSNNELFYTLFFTLSVSPQRKMTSYSAIAHNNLKRFPSSQQHPHLVRCTMSFCIAPNFYTESDERDGVWQRSFKHSINFKHLN